MNKLKKDQRFHYDVTLVTKYKNIQKVFLLLVFVTLGKVYHCSLPVDALGGHVFLFFFVFFGCAQMHMAKQLFFFHAPILSRSRVTVHTRKLNLCPDFSRALKKKTINKTGCLV